MRDSIWLAFLASVLGIWLAFLASVLGIWLVCMTSVPYLHLAYVTDDHGVISKLWFKFGERY